MKTRDDYEITCYSYFMGGILGLCAGGMIALLMSTEPINISIIIPICIMVISCVLLIPAFVYYKKYKAMV